MTAETRIGAGPAGLAAAAAARGSARAQTFVSYTCADGTNVSAAFFKGERGMRMQLDGKALSLPQRLAVSGARYAKSGVSFWIKGQEATLKRPKKKATLCKASEPPSRPEREPESESDNREPGELRYRRHLAERKKADQDRHRRHQRRKHRGASGAERGDRAGEQIDSASSPRTRPARDLQEILARPTAAMRSKPNTSA